MKKKLFLSGPPCSGKSGMIIEALGGSLACAGGYFTRKLFSGDGAPLGLELLPAAAAAGVEGFKALRYIDLGGGRPVKDNEVFRTEAVRLLNEAEYYPFAVLDEIGGFELVIPQYRDALAAFLSSPVPCIGVLKTIESFEAERSLLGLGERPAALAARLRSALESHPDTLIVPTKGRGDARAEALVREWAANFAE